MLDEKLSLGGKKYFVTFVDGVTWKVWVYLTLFIARTKCWQIKKIIAIDLE